MDLHSFYPQDPDLDPHSEKMLDPDQQKMNADPQPWAKGFLCGSNRIRICSNSVKKLRGCH